MTFFITCAFERDLVKCSGLASINLEIIVVDKHLFVGLVAVLDSTYAAFARSDAINHNSHIRKTQALLCRSEHICSALLVEIADT